MALDVKQLGTTGTQAEVIAGGYQLSMTEPDAYTNGDKVGGSRAMGEVDAGFVTGSVVLRPLELDADYRARVSQDLLLDEEVFNYTAQNTGKHNLASTTMASTFTAGQWTTNSGSITTTTTGVQLSTYATFPVVGTTTLSMDVGVAFSAQPTTNTFIEWGVGVPGGATAEPSDGVFFRVSSSGVQGICSYNASETSTGVFPLSGGTGTWTYTNNKRYQFIVYQSMVEAVFWVNDGTGAVMLGRIPLPVGQPRMSMGGAAVGFFKHRITGGAAAGVLQAFFGAYNVRQGGVNYTSLPGTSGNRMFGSYQGSSGGTMGSLAAYANSANPTAAVPTNTTAALGTGLGGQVWETDTLAVTTDGVILSYQVPAATANFSGRRLVVHMVRVQSFVQTALTGGGYVASWSLAFGHTAVSLATAEAATTKAPRRVPLGLQTVASAAAALTLLQTVEMDFGDAPVFVNPGEFIAVVKKKIGTAPSAGVIAHLVTYTYGWE
jgi:hypothetical protein